MEGEGVVDLLDALWLHLNIFQNPLVNPHSKLIYSPKSSNTIHSRSKSDELILHSSSPDSVRELPKAKPPQLLSKKMMRKRLSKSLSELEFEEVKGFMEIGFVLSGDEKDPRLVDIIPGLQRLGGGGQSADRRIRRPYLSEAWENDPMMMDWRVLLPAATGNEMEMKDSIKSWAHNVASALRV